MFTSDKIGGLMAVAARAEEQKQWFADIVRPRLYLPDQFGGVYYPVDVTSRSLRRNHHLAEFVSLLDVDLTALWIIGQGFKGMA